MLEISHRAEEMPQSPIRKLAPLADAAKAKGVHVFHLNIGQPDLPTPEVGLEALKHVTRQTLEYSPSQGFLSYRKRLVDYYKTYNINLTTDDIIITTGGSEAVQLAFMVCLNPGDEVITTEPTINRLLLQLAQRYVRLALLLMMDSPCRKLRSLKN